MANQTPKSILVNQARLPKTSLTGTPLAPLGEGISGILNTIASALPEIPGIPQVAGLQTPQAPPVIEFIRSVETGLPTGLPKISQAVSQSNEVPPAPVKAPKLIFE